MGAGAGKEEGPDEWGAMPNSSKFKGAGPAGEEAFGGTTLGAMGAWGVIGTGGG